MRTIKISRILLFASLIAAGCSGNGSDGNDEDLEAKKILQGVWVNEDSGTPSLMAKDDSIFYPDTASMPVRFWIRKDSLYLQGSNICRYKIRSLSDRQLVINNRNEEELHLTRGNDSQMMSEFTQERPYAMNIMRTLRADTVVNAGNVRYDCNIYLEPTSERVVKSSYNDDGIEVDNLYLDNVAHLKVTGNGVKVFAHDYRKQEFSAFVPDEFLKRSILRDFRYSHAEGGSVFFNVTIGIPDATTCYVVELKVDKEGKTSKNLR